MLLIEIPEDEYFDEEKSCFITMPGGTLELEHSLASIHDWEAKWHKAFLGKKEKTEEEATDYIRCMTLNEVDDSLYYRLTQSDIQKIKEYVTDSQTSVVFPDSNESESKDTMTAEMIYYYMFSLQIPIECEKWHLNRLIALIRVMNIKNKPGKKVNESEQAAYYAKLNKARKAKMQK